MTKKLVIAPAESAPDAKPGAPDAKPGLEFPALTEIYDPGVVMDLANNHSALALRNADNWEHFAANTKP